MNHMPQTLANLSGQRVLVTRPAHQSAEQIRLLTDRGATALPLPMLSIRPIDETDPRYQSIKAQIMNLDEYRVIICVSPNAAQLAIDWIDEYWPQLPIGIEWLAIGGKTEAMLKAAGIPATRPTEGFNSEAMLTMPTLTDLDNAKVLILRGNGGRTTLAEALSDRGAHVEYANLYDRSCPCYEDALIQSSIYQSSLTSILITSGEALDNFVTVARGRQQKFSINSLLSLYLVVPSERIADKARTIGFTTITVAQGPDDESMINALTPANDSEANA